MAKTEKFLLVVFLEASWGELELIRVVVPKNCEDEDEEKERECCWGRKHSGERRVGLLRWEALRVENEEVATWNDSAAMFVGDVWDKQNPHTHTQREMMRDTGL
jgi:hypothetical protein